MMVELWRADGQQQVPSDNELKTALEKGNDEQKIETMVRLPQRACPAAQQQLG
jgi:hypothetical protein